MTLPILLAMTLLASQAQGATIAHETIAPATASTETTLAQLCVRNDTERPVRVASAWGVGDPWHEYLMPAGGEMIYRLVKARTGVPQELKVRWLDASGRGEAGEKRIVAVWSNERSIDCSMFPSYKFVGGTRSDGYETIDLVTE